MPAESVSEEISRLKRKGPSRGPEKGKPYGRKRAIAAALNMKRSGKIDRGKSMRKKGRRS